MSNILNISNIDDKEILSRTSLDVNIRLLLNSVSYKELIDRMIHYLATECGSKLGLAASSIGIPFRIIAINSSDSPIWRAYKYNNGPAILINPRISKSFGGSELCHVNCSILSLREAIEVYRFKNIDLDFFDVNGKKHYLQRLGRTEGAYILQHEIDHTNGILITQRGRP